MTTARKTQIAAVDMIMRQIQVSGWHRQHFPADSAQVTRPIPGHRNRPSLPMLVAVRRRPAAPHPGSQISTMVLSNQKKTHPMNVRR
jgi:hypothetical protein